MPMSESIHNFPGLKVKQLAKTGNEHWKLDYSSMVGDASPLKLHFKCNRISYECSVRYGLLRFKWHNQFFRVYVCERKQFIPIFVPFIRSFCLHWFFAVVVVVYLKQSWIRFFMLLRLWSHFSSYFSVIAYRKTISQLVSVMIENT